MARLDRFMPVKEIAQIGAAIGREFSYELIAAVAPMPQTELDSALDQLTESGLAFRRGTPPEATYTFKHALVQDAAYDSLLKSRRQALHAKIARVLEERLPADQRHRTRAAGASPDGGGAGRSGDWLLAEGGQLALKRLALNEAISHLNQGMELIGTLPSHRSAMPENWTCALCLARPGWRSKAGRRLRCGPASTRRWGWPSPSAATRR